MPQGKRIENAAWVHMKIMQCCVLMALKFFKKMLRMNKQKSRGPHPPKESETGKGNKG